MSGKRLVLDTNVLIYLSKGELDFAQITAGYTYVFISVISYIETLGYSFKNEKEKNLIAGFLHLLEIVQTDLTLAESAIEYRMHSKIKIPDAIILATAKTLGADLVTNNTKDFIEIDATVKLIDPFKD